MSNIKDAKLDIRINSDLKEKAAKLAAEDGRTLSNLVTHLLTQYIKERA